MPICMQRIQSLKAVQFVISILERPLNIPCTLFSEGIPIEKYGLNMNFLIIWKFERWTNTAPDFSS